MNLHTGLLLAATLLPGCVIFSTPPNNAAFGELRSIHDLEGSWKNEGEHGTFRGDLFLSSVIWPNSTMDHKAITTVKVRAISERKLQATAFSKCGVVKESIFTEGQDFSIEDGRLLLRRNTGLAADALAGPNYETIELGLDEHGQGKYRADGAVAGLAYLVVPVAAVTREEVRFIRVSTHEC